jgi:hypothetical protein
VVASPLTDTVHEIPQKPAGFLFQQLHSGEIHHDLLTPFRIEELHGLCEQPVCRRPVNPGQLEEPFERYRPFGTFVLADDRVLEPPPRKQLELLERETTRGARGTQYFPDNLRELQSPVPGGAYTPYLHEKFSSAP